MNFHDSDRVQSFGHGQGGRPPFEIKITQEEKDAFRQCSREAYLLAGLPFATILHFATKHIKKKNGPGTPLPPEPVSPNAPLMKHPSLKTGLMFFANVLIGHFFYLPVCAKRIGRMIENREKEQSEGMPELIPVEENISGSDELNTQSLNPTMDDSNFSHMPVDFEPTISDKPILEDEKVEKPKVPTISYEELRRQNRAKYESELPPQYRSVRNYSNPNNRQTEQQQSPPRRVAKNKYGDDME